MGSPAAPDPYKALREQARHLKQHNQQVEQLITTRNNLKAA